MEQRPKILQTGEPLIICTTNIVSTDLQNERFTPPADNHNTTGQFEPSVHGFDGVTSVCLPGFPQGTDDRILRVTAELPDEFPYNRDYNSGKPLGVGVYRYFGIFFLRGLRKF